MAICIAANFVEGEFEETCQTPFEPLTSQGRVRINRSDPAGAAACPVPGRWQRRRHRIPAPWLGRRVGHRSRKVSCGKRRPADGLRTRRRAEGRNRAVFLTRRDPLDPMPSRTGLVAPAARCKNSRRASFILNLPLPSLEILQFRSPATRVPARLAR